MENEGVCELTKHNKFAAIGKFFGEAKEPLCVDAYERYRAKYGAERAEGYLQAIKDMNEALGDITRPPYAVGNQKIRSDTDKLFTHNHHFLKSLEIK